MGLELKRRSKQFLNKISNARDLNDVDGVRIFGIRNFPDFFGEGKNSFRIKPQPRSIVSNTEIQIEILDSNGNTIYWEAPTYKDNDKSQVISVWVYSDNNDRYHTPDGICQVTLVANGRDGIIRYTRRVNVVKNQQSISDIVFVDSPIGDVSSSIDTFNELPQTNGKLTRTSQVGVYIQKITIW